MGYPISMEKNDYNKNTKNSAVYTPIELAQYVCDLLYDSQSLHGIQNIFDPCVGTGNLLLPFNDFIFQLYGMDIDENIKTNKNLFWKHTIGNFLEVDELQCPKKETLIICNPPFNSDFRNKRTKKLLPELFFRKIVDIFGISPVVLFVPMGFRLNQRINSKRYKYLRSCQMPITSILTLPIDIFQNVLFHSEVLFFNLPKLRPHYFLQDDIFKNKDLSLFD